MGKNEDKRGLFWRLVCFDKKIERRQGGLPAFYFMKERLSIDNVSCGVFYIINVS